LIYVTFAISVFTYIFVNRKVDTAVLHFLSELVVNQLQYLLAEFMPSSVVSGFPPKENVQSSAPNLSSQSFNLGPPVGQSTPAPATNKVLSQLRYDTALPANTAAAVKTTAVPSAISKPSSAPTGHTTAGDLTFQLNYVIILYYARWQHKNKKKCSSTK